MYITYILRCTDNSLYTGIAKDLSKRLREHREKDPKGAKYTRGHQILKVEAAFESENRSTASKLEYAIKRLSKEKKEKLILCPDALEEILPSFSAEDYRFCSPEKLSGEKGV